MLELLKKKKKREEKRREEKRREEKNMGMMLYKMERFKAMFWQNMAGSDVLAYQTASLALV